MVSCKRLLDRCDKIKVRGRISACAGKKRVPDRVVQGGGEFGILSP